MTSKEFTKRVHKLGLQSAGDVARVLGMSRSGAWMVMSGDRPVTPRTERALMLIETTMPVGLTYAMLRLLASVHEEADPIEPPPPRSNFDLGEDWDAVIEELFDRKLVTFRQGRPVATALGAEAITWYRMHGMIDDLETERRA